MRAQMLSWTCQILHWETGYDLWSSKIVMFELLNTINYVFLLKRRKDKMKELNLNPGPVKVSNLSR